MLMSVIQEAGPVGDGLVDAHAGIVVLGVSLAMYGLNRIRAFADLDNRVKRTAMVLTAMVIAAAADRLFGLHTFDSINSITQIITEGGASAIVAHSIFTIGQNNPPRKR